MSALVALFSLVVAESASANVRGPLTQANAEVRVEAKAKSRGARSADATCGPRQANRRNCAVEYVSRGGRQCADSSVTVRRVRGARGGRGFLRVLGFRGTCASTPGGTPTLVPVPGPSGPSGPTGTAGRPGVTQVITTPGPIVPIPSPTPPDAEGVVRVNSITRCDEDPNTVPGPCRRSPFEATNDSHLLFGDGTPSLTADGVAFGPYDSPLFEGGSMCFNGINGSQLAAIESLQYESLYNADGAGNQGQAAPRLIIGTQDASGGDHTILFHPNTQPSPAIQEGVFNRHAVTSGTVSYDGAAPASYTSVRDAHNLEVIQTVCVEVGRVAVAGPLNAILRELVVDTTTTSLTTFRFAA